MKVTNREAWESVMDRATEYITSLTDDGGKSLLSSRRKTGFLGFLSNIVAFRSMFDAYVTTGDMKYLLTYKASQVICFTHLICARDFKNRPN